MNLRQLAYGLISFTPVSMSLLERGTGGSDSAEYCYGVWLRHIVLSANGGMRQFPRTVAEIGPGDSIGVGLAALISGVERYLAFDAIEHAIPERNLRIFDELVALFKRRTPPPGADQFPELKPHLPSPAFPSHLLDDTALDAAMSPSRLTRLREQILAENRKRTSLQYMSPWSGTDFSSTDTVDLIISQAVMEHVEDLPHAYAAMFRWLRPGGYASHQIDFRSHGLFSSWDGHWAAPDWLWALFKGRRRYLLNRQPCSIHLELSAKAGFKLAEVTKVHTEPVSIKLSKRFRDMRPEDRSTSGLYLLLSKPAP